MNSLSMICSFRLWVMKCKASAIFMVFLASSVVFYSCLEEKGISKSEPEPTFSVSGSIVGYNPAVPVEGITVMLDGLYISDTCVTGPNGEFIFSDFEEATYDISPIEDPESIYYFFPESRQITLSKDITVTNFTVYKYVQLFLENNSPKTISGVCLSRNIRQPVWTDNIFSNDLGPFSVSDRVKLKHGTWLLKVNWSEGLEQGEDMINIGTLSPGDSSIYPLNSIMKVENKGSTILFSVIMDRVFYYEGVTLKMSCGELLETPVLPGAESEEIYVWPGLHELECSYCVDSDTNFVTIEDYNIAAGDTVLFSFE
jgi:hypothetical protein